MALENSGPKVTGDNIRNILLQKDFKTDVRISALKVSTSNYSNGLFKGKCYKCGKIFHSKQQCDQYSKASKVLITALFNDASKNTEWFIYNGASSHMSHQKKWFENLTDCDHEMFTANEEILKCKGRRNIYC